MPDWADRAASALVAENARLVEPGIASAPARPGLYAVHAPAEVWCELGLGKPPDPRPLYVGKSESSLAGRDVNTHFGFDGHRRTSTTGGSTLRRSLAALLHDSRGFRGVPRNRANPGHFANYGLTQEQDTALSVWMRERLLLACWAKPLDCPEPLRMIERTIVRRMLPPLNLASVVTPWKPGIKVARRLMATEARAWSAEP